MDLFHVFERYFNDITISSSPKVIDSYLDSCDTFPVLLSGCLSRETFNLIDSYLKKYDPRKGSFKSEEERQSFLDDCSKPNSYFLLDSDLNLLIELGFYDYESNTYNERFISIFRKLRSKKLEHQRNFYFFIFSIMRASMRAYGYIDLEHFYEIINCYFKESPLEKDALISALNLDILFAFENIIDNNHIISLSIKDVDSFLQLKEKYGVDEYKLLTLNEIFDFKGGAFDKATLFGNIEPKEYLLDLKNEFSIYPKPYKDLCYSLSEEDKKIFDEFNENCPKFYLNGFSINEFEIYLETISKGKMN